MLTATARYLWFFLIDPLPAGAVAPHAECEEITPEQGVKAAEWAIEHGVMIELYVSSRDRDEREGLPFVGWVVGGDCGHHVGFGLGSDETDALEKEVTARTEPAFDPAWFRSLLERSLAG